MDGVKQLLLTLYHHWYRNRYGILRWYLNIARKHVHRPIPENMELADGSLKDPRNIEFDCASSRKYLKFGWNSKLRSGARYSILNEWSQKNEPFFNPTIRWALEMMLYHPVFAWNNGRIAFCMIFSMVPNSMHMFWSSISWNILPNLHAHAPEREFECVLSSKVLCICQQIFVPCHN